MKQLIFSATAFALALPFCASATDFGKLLDQSGGSAVKFGVESASYSRNADVPFAPASNSKMFTALALLEKMGGNSTIPTVVQWSWTTGGGAVAMRLIGYGDPSYGLSEFGESTTTRVTKMAKLVWDAGVREIYGDVTAVAADARFETLRYPEGWTADDPNTCDGALGQAFNMNLNCGSYQVTSCTTGQWLQGGLVGGVSVQLTEAASTRILVGLADPHNPSAGWIVKGTLKKGAKPSFALPVLNAKDWIKNLFVAALKKQGVKMNTGAAPAAGGMQEVVSNSPALSLIVKAMMKNSINMIGDALFKIIASNYAVPAGPDLVADGQSFLRNYLLNIGVPANFTLYDGAGLSRQSRVTPHVMYAFLNYAKDSQEFKSFFAALPIAGVDGTLRNRMKGTAAANRLRAKTGTLNGVYNLSGFVPSGNTYVPFVLLTSTEVGRAAVARGAEDRFGAALASGLRRALEPQLEQTPFPYVPEHAGMDNQ